MSIAAALCAAAIAVWLVQAAPAVAAPHRHAGGPARGLDVSAFQHDGGPINWRLLARRGIRFVAIKVSEGTYYTNPYYRADARAAGAAGLAVLPYVFANPRRSGGAAQASFGVRAARYRGRAGLLGVDLENDPYAVAGHPADCYGQPVRRMVAWVAAFVTKTEALTGKPPVIYTTAAWWRECTGNTGRFRRDPLWVAAYDTRVPGVPSPWKQWTFWQYSDEARIAGVGVTDVDYFHPTAALPTLRGVAARHPGRRKRAHKRTPAHHAKRHSSHPPRPVARPPRPVTHPTRPVTHPPRPAPRPPTPRPTPPPTPQVRTWWVPPYVAASQIRP
jgi:lysozyme